ncbi:hypothetical protein YC2023_096475 [Brassica napus]
MTPLFVQLHVLKEELEEAKQAIKESAKKLKLKEETAAAAMGARDAAERSLRLVDNRATRLRERMQELNRKVEELETHRDMNSSNRARYEVEELSLNNNNRVRTRWNSLNLYYDKTGLMPCMDQENAIFVGATSLRNNP